MKITRRQLRQVINEELRLLEADRDGDGSLSPDELRGLAGELEDNVTTLSGGRRVIKPKGYENVSVTIDEKAKEIGSGFIIDVNDMEASGGGFYPLYRVVGGNATLDVKHIGDLAYAVTEESRDQNPIMIGGTAIHVFPNDEEWQVINDDF